MIFINHANAISIEIDESMDGVRTYIFDLMRSNPQKALESNPYVYVGPDNQYYRNIVNIRSPALQYLRNKIAESKNDGLEEYILAIAMEEIAKVNLKGENQSYHWSHAKGFVPVWDQHLKNIPKNVDSIVSSNIPNMEKFNKLNKLGTPAIPYIMDKIEEGSTYLVPALNELLIDNKKVIFDKDSIKDYQEWVKSNKDNFKDLRSLVESAQNQ